MFFLRFIKLQKVLILLIIFFIFFLSGIFVWLISKNEATGEVMKSTKYTSAEEYVISNQTIKNEKQGFYAEIPANFKVLKDNNSIFLENDDCGISIDISNSEKINNFPTDVDLILNQIKSIKGGTSINGFEVSEVSEKEALKQTVISSNKKLKSISVDLPVGLKIYSFNTNCENEFNDFLKSVLVK